jgi:hypothetical protein
VAGLKAFNRALKRRIKFLARQRFFRPAGQRLVNPVLDSFGAERFLDLKTHLNAGQRFLIEAAEIGGRLLLQLRMKIIGDAF